MRIFKKICLLFVLVTVQLSGHCRFGTYEGGPKSNFVGDFEADVIQGGGTLEGTFVCHRSLDLSGCRIYGVLIFEGQAGVIKDSHIGALVIRKSDDSAKSQVIRLGANSVIDLLQNDTPITVVVEGADVSVGGKQLNVGTHEFAACPITIIPRSESADSPPRPKDATSFFGRSSDWFIPVCLITAAILGTVISRWQEGKPIFS